LSRGPGHLQRRILEMLGPRQPGEIPETRARATADLARQLFELRWGSSLGPAQRASVSRALNSLRKCGLVEVERKSWLGRSAAVWRLTEAAWRQADKRRQQQAGAARRENGRRRREKREERARAHEEAYEALKAELRQTKQPKPTERLAHILGMLGSAHEGERAAAARKAEEECRRLGTTWHELLLGNRKP
jgi:hypothetical protein